MSDPLAWISEELRELDRRGLRRSRRTVTSLPGGRCRVDGRELLNFASNDYLGLAHDARVIEAARAALCEAGSGATASALVCGRTEWHAALEERIAAFERKPAVLLFPTGYAANSGTIPSLVSRSDVIFSDELNHASLVDGCRLSRADVSVYRHNDMGELERHLQAWSGARRKLIVTESLFSMDGDAARLTDICDLADRYDAAVMVDEAHATGLFGDTGTGFAEELGVEDRIAVRVGTLSKAIGCLGGFVTGSEELVEWLRNRGRPHMFSTALPPAVCAAASAALEIIEAEPQRRRDLLSRSDWFRGQVRSAGLETVESTIGPIIPVILKSPERALHTSKELQARGFLVPAIRPPTVPEGTSRLRITLSSAHTEEDLRRLSQAIIDVVMPVGANDQ